MRPSDFEVLQQALGMMSVDVNFDVVVDSEGHSITVNSDHFKHNYLVFDFDVDGRLQTVI